MVFSSEGWKERDQLIDDTASAPNVSFLVILFLVNLLGTHVVGSSNISLGKAFGILDNITFDDL